MKNKLNTLYIYIKLFGFDPIVFLNTSKSIYFYLRDFYILNKQKGNNKLFSFGRIFPILDERFQESGSMKGHYFHQDIEIARKVYINNPIRHIDIGSRTDGFVAHVEVFREIEIIDIRE